MNFWGLFYCFSNIYNKKTHKKMSQKNSNFVAKKLVTLCYDRSRALQRGFKALFILWGLIYRFCQKNVLKTIIRVFRHIQAGLCIYPPFFLSSATIAYPFSKFFYFFYFFYFFGARTNIPFKAICGVYFV